VTRGDASSSTSTSFTVDVAEATRGGYKGSVETLRAELQDRLQLIRDLDAEFSDSGHNPIALLKAIAHYGGISIKAESAQSSSAT
jgi:hypothetical protein